MRLGEQILVRVEEVTYEGALIIEFAGMLFRVLNQSNQKFSNGDRVYLKVSSESPLEFQLQKKNKDLRSRSRLDRQI